MSAVPTGTTIGEADLPPEVRVVGRFVTALAWTDRLGRNVLVLSESTELRHEPGVRWSPTEFVVHFASHHSGDGTTALRGRDELFWLCSNPDRRHGARAPRLTDVDRDGIAEVTGGLEARCGDEDVLLPWAFEAGEDLFHKPPEGRALCGGDGRLTPSLRGTPFEPHLRRRWQRAAGLLEATIMPTPAVERAARAFAAAPITTPHVAAVEVGLGWTDRTGENVFLASARVAAQLRRDPSGWTVVWRHEQGGDACPEDDATAFVRDALDLTDLDGDGISEVTFAQTFGCVSDVSSVNTSLFLFEGAERHAVHGKSWVRYDDCLPVRPLRFEDDPILRLLDGLDPARHMPR